MFSPSVEHGAGEFRTYSRLTGGFSMLQERRSGRECLIGQHEYVLHHLAVIVVGASSLATPAACLLVFGDVMTGTSSTSATSLTQTQKWSSLLAHTPTTLMSATSTLMPLCSCWTLAHSASEGGSPIVRFRYAV